MIGRADIEGSKSNVAMNAWLPQASYPCGNFSDTSSFKFRRSKGSLGHAFTVRIRTGNQNQTSFYPSVPHEISVLVELILGHLRYLLTDVPPQPNSPPDNVFRPDRPAEAGLGSKKRGIAPLPIHGIIGFPLSVPVLSWLFDARGRPPKEPFPSPSPGRHAATRSRRGSSSSSPPTADGFGTGTPVPSPQSQSFSRGYGSILPTSLAYIVPSTRGCSPWRPDAVMSTTRAWEALGPPDFQGPPGAHRTPRDVRCSSSRWTLPPTESSAPTAAPPRLTPKNSHPGSSYPEGNFGGNQLLDGSISLSPLYPSQTNDFARQYRCGPPPEFPLASPRSGIVHHHSGPDRHCSHSNPSQKYQGRSAVHPARGIPPISFLAPCGLYSPVDSHTCQTPWSVFQDGPNGVPTGRCREHAGISPRRRVLPTTIDATASPRAYRQLGLWPPHQSAPVHAPSRSADRLSPFPHPTGTHRRPPFASLPTIFKHSLTLFSKSFHLSLARGLGPGPAAEDASPDYNSDSEAVRFSSWADPGSLAVTKGILGLSSQLTTHDTIRGSFQPPLVRASTEGDSSLGQPHHKHGRPISAPMPCVPIRDAWLGATRCVTPMAGVPSAGWLWAQLAFKKLDGSRDSAIHTKYRILLRSSSMREPRYPLPRVVVILRRPRPTRTPRTGRSWTHPSHLLFSLAHTVPEVHVHGSFCFAGFDNDPSAGSPTETLLRLLLPLNDKVQWNSRDVAGGEPPTSPRS
ncbi:hypothetical protein L1887_50412 [Cichorium endivia]|nr:hypothetical protein L1887_50412 [Cichorium endivia]